MSAPEHMADVARERALRVNEAQRAYYNQTDGNRVSDANNRVTNLWRSVRLRAQGAVSGAARRKFYDRHRDWMGDLSQAKVLELGCGAGSQMSSYLAREAKSYHALDLSDRHIAALRKKLKRAKTAQFHAADFLSDGFTERGFDVIYARSVFHHFEDIDVLFGRINHVLKPGGQILTLDPVQAWPPARLIRLAFRPFQTDAAWEFPFTSATLRKIERHFQVEHCMALFRRAKWAMALSILHPPLGARFGDAWYQADLDRAPTSADKRAALQISYCLRRPA
jgi:ubiquinone/menaquinone biosynthesis C-methylase UbiE